MNPELAFVTPHMHRKFPFSIHASTRLYSGTRFYTIALGGLGLVAKVQPECPNYDINQALNAIVTRAEMVEGAQG